MATAVQYALGIVFAGLAGAFLAMQSGINSTLGEQRHMCHTGLFYNLIAAAAAGCCQRFSIAAVVAF
mgnify:CR=1 FL=1